MWCLNLSFPDSVFHGKSSSDCLAFHSLCKKKNFFSGKKESKEEQFIFYFQTMKDQDEVSQDINFINLSLRKQAKMAISCFVKCKFVYKFVSDHFHV